MKRYVPFFSCLLLILTLVCTVFLAVSCDSGDKDDTDTTESTTEAVSADAAEVDALIAAIDGATLESEDKIDDAYLAYCALSDEEKAKVTGYDTLQNLRYELTKQYVVKEYMDTRMRHNELLIGAYCCYAGSVDLYTDERMQDMVDCYIDFTWQSRNPEQHLKYGIGMFPFTGDLGIPFGNDPISVEDFRSQLVAGKNYDHEAYWGIFHCDEPPASHIAGRWETGKIIMEELLPEGSYLMNLLPNYAMVMPSYADYVETFVKSAESDFICYDHYIYGKNGYNGGTDENGNEVVGGNALTAMLDNLDIVSQYCREYDRDLYVLLQAFTNEENEGFLSLERIKFQAYSAMAYGAKSISWACWITGFGVNNVLDDEGNKTETYDKLKETNGDLVALEPVYMRYTGASNAVLLGNKPPLSVRDRLALYHGNTDVDNLTQTSLSELSAGEGSAVIVGHFEKNVGEGEAFMFVGCNNYLFLKEQTATATFKTADPDAVITAYVKGVASRLTPDTNGVYTVEIHNADAVFVTVD